MYSVCTVCRPFMINYIQYHFISYTSAATTHHLSADSCEPFLAIKTRKERHAHFIISTSKHELHVHRNYFFVVSFGSVLSPTATTIALFVSHYYVGELELKRKRRAELHMQPLLHRIVVMERTAGITAPMLLSHVYTISRSTHHYGADLHSTRCRLTPSQVWGHLHQLSSWLANEQALCKSICAQQHKTLGCYKPER